MLRSALITTFAAALAVPALAACTYSQLQEVTASYVAAQTAGKLPDLASGATYTENFKAADIAAGLLTKPLKIDNNRSIHDTVECSTFTEVIAASNSPPYVIGTQIHLTDDGSAIKQIDSLITTNGDWAFNATGTLYWTRQELSKGGWDTIPEASRDTREVIKAAADAYFDQFADNSVQVPFGRPCARLEGGSYTGRGTDSDSCEGLPPKATIPNRRYVIDETLGSVDVFDNFGGNDGNPDSHNFRLIGGKIRYIHTITYGIIPF